MRTTLLSCAVFLIATPALANHVVVINKPSDLQQLQTTWSSTGSSDVVSILNNTTNVLEVDVSVDLLNGDTPNSAATVQCDSRSAAPAITVQPGSAIACEVPPLSYSKSSSTNISSASSTSGSSGQYAFNIVR